MKSLKAFGIAALIASSATAAFAGIDDDAAAQTPFVRAEAAASAVTTSAVAATDGNAAVQTPFVVAEAAVTRNATSMELDSVSYRPAYVSEDDAAAQTPFVYAD